jgi:DNA-directed RNA polymerase sigma subunit (sigma70/sigma32)
MMVIVKNVMQSLSTKEAAILRLRFGLYEDVENADYEVSDAEAHLILTGKGLT